MELIASSFEGVGRDGDFAWMIRNPQYEDSFFVFNDNESQYRAHLSHAPGSNNCVAGGGNAIIRPWQCRIPQRAAGIPTGDRGGYQTLDDQVRAVITEASQRAVSAAHAVGAERVYYSADAADPRMIGTGIFDVAAEVRRFAVTALESALLE